MEQERFLLLAVQAGPEEDVEASLRELEALAATAGAETAGWLIQRREAPHPGAYLGKGKLEEAREALAALDATGVLCDDELSPAQMYHLQEALDCKVLDRTLLILDIFARHASTREGKLQVELAQLQYRAAHLAGSGAALSRLGGGIGTRGPGEKKLEIDRRLIRSRIHALKEELDGVVRHRALLRSQRERARRPTAALVGYTSVGKSALFRRLTGADVLEDPKLFATLDTTTRTLTLPGSKQEILLTDTVGFIRKLPHHLIEAFQSTLEEACYADVLLHVQDASSPQLLTQQEVVYQTLAKLGAAGKPVIAVFNKMDLNAEAPQLRDLQAETSLAVSAATGEGLGRLCGALERTLRARARYLEGVLPYGQGGLLQELRALGELQEEQYLPEGVAVRAYAPEALYGKLLPHLRPLPRG